MAYFDIGVSAESEVCNYLLKSTINISASKTFTYTATKRARLVITMYSARSSFTSYSVQKNGVAVQELSASATDTGYGECHSYSVEVQNSDEVVISVVIGSGTYNYGNLNVFEITTV